MYNCTGGWGTKVVLQKGSSQQEPFPYIQAHQDDTAIKKLWQHPWASIGALEVHLITHKNIAS